MPWLHYYVSFLCMSTVKSIQGATRRVQRRVNLLATYEQLVSGAYAISAIASNIGVTRPAAESIVDDLNKLGWLTQLQPDKSFGRPAIRWTVNSRTVYVLGLDIGAHHCTSMLSDLRGEVISEETIELPPDLPAQERLERASATGLTVIKKAELSKEDITLCAVASPGVIDNGIVRYFGGSGMPGWQGRNIVSEVSRAFGRRAIVAGDCALGALGEAWQGAAVGHDDVVYVLSGERTGAAAIINGRIHRGYLGAAGLIGELAPLRWREIEAGTYVQQLYETANIPSRTEIFSKYYEDQQSREIVDDFADALALGTAAMILALGPSHVVLGGKYSTFADRYLTRFIDNLMDICPIMPEVSVSKLGSRAICLGAVRYGLDYINESLSQSVLSTDVFPSVEGFNQHFEHTF